MIARFICGALTAATLVFSLTANAKTLIYCSEGSPEGFNPQLYASQTTADASSRQIYNRLVEFKLGSTELIPALAESWSISDDGKVYTFKLRRHVRWHTTSSFTPTRDFNADDVVFSFERQFKKDHPFHKVSGGNYEYFNGMGMQKLLKSVEKVDEFTVKFTLNQPEAPFIANLGMDFASILSAEYANKMMAAGTPGQVNLDPVGTGPFQLVQYRKDAVIRYKAHPDYFRGRAAIDDLVFAVTPDASVRFAKLKAGECHVIPYPNPADIDALETDPDITVLKQEGLNIGYLALHTEKPPLNDRRVRQALNYAVNKQAIIDAVFQHAGRMAKNPIPPAMWSYNEDTRDYPYDPARAKRLLAEAGYPDGFETDIWAMPVQRPYNPNAKRMAELLQADFANIGVKAKIITYEWGEYLKRSKAGEHETLLLGWASSNGDPDHFLYGVLGCAGVGGLNRAQWCHKPFDDLLVQAKRTTDVAKRTELYRRAQEIYIEEVPWVAIAHSVVFMPIRRSVTGYVVDPFGGHNFYGVDLE